MIKPNIEVALDKINSRFDLINVASRRAHQLQKRKSDALISVNEDKSTNIALKEIEIGLINNEIMDNFERMIELKRHHEAQKFIKESSNGEKNLNLLTSSQSFIPESYEDTQIVINLEEAQAKILEEEKSVEILEEKV